MALLTIQFTPDPGPPRRHRFEPTDSDQFLRIEETWTGCTWRIEGCEHVNDIHYTSEEVSSE